MNTTHSSYGFCLKCGFRLWLSTFTVENAQFYVITCESCDAVDDPQYEGT